MKSRSRRRIGLVPALLSLWAGCGGQAIDGEACEGAGCPVISGGACVVDGLEVPNGFVGSPGEDACRTCQCDDSVLSCTMACSDEACSYEGSSYESGASFPAENGCSQCFCDRGNVYCDDSACRADCRFPGGRIPDGAYRVAEDGCNTCRCSDGEMRCTELDCEGRCISNEACASGAYCAFFRGSCGTADWMEGDDYAPAVGECAELPIGCPDVMDPVCGCDGQTYANECNAAARGVNVRSAGACG